jgi:hypothetical protein
MAFGTPSDKDLMLSSHLERAIRELEQAVDIARRTSRDREAKTRDHDLLRSLQRHVWSLREVEGSIPRRSREQDLDSLSEDELSKRAREKAAQKKAAKTFGIKRGSGD